MPPSPKQEYYTWYIYQSLIKKRIALYYIMRITITGEYLKKVERKEEQLYTLELSAWPSRRLILESMRDFDSCVVLGLYLTQAKEDFGSTQLNGYPFCPWKGHVSCYSPCFSPYLSPLSLDWFLVEKLQYCPSLAQNVIAENWSRCNRE